MAWKVPAPDLYASIPEADRASRTIFADEVCTIDDEYFFILGCLDIAVAGSEECFRWLAWASLSKETFRRCETMWSIEGREAEPPYFAWLANNLPGYPSTLSLRANLITCPIGVRPQIKLEPTDHPLASEQRDGISPQRVKEIAELMHHLHDGAKA